MSLPKLTIQSYTMTIPSSGKKVKFRPFLSKEEKILMMVKQSSNSEEILSSVREIVDVCTYQKLDTKQLALFDLEYIFLQLRAKSVGEVIEIDMKCINEVDKIIPAVEGGGDTQTIKKPCGGVIPFVINIEDIKVNVPEGHTKTISLENDIGITMRYPSVDDVEMLEANKDDDIEIIFNLIESIYDKDQIYDVADTSKEELQEFVDNLSTKLIEKIRKEFFYTMPTLSHTIKYKCAACGVDGEYTFSGINDFF